MDGRRPPLLVTLACLLALALAGPAAASAAAAPASPAARWPAGGSTLRAALAIGAEHWGMTPCRGRVAVGWAALGPAINARSTWANDLDPYRQPSFNTDCAIALSTQVEWDWPKLCTVIVHEVGHLDGHEHADDPGDVMFPEYLAPVAECATTPEPAETGPSPAPVRPRAAAKPRTSPKRRTAAKPRAATRRRRR